MNYVDTLLGATIDGRYFIQARIARGGMASVYRARDLRLDRDVALKIIHPHLAEQADFTRRFIQEARSAAALNHPNIVGVHDQGIAQTPDGNRAYLVMELITGPDLRSELRRHGSFTLGQSLQIIQQILQALAAAHEKNLIHRDVKPENILLERELPSVSVVSQENIQAKVADFGLARAVSDATGMHTSTVLGTVAYIAPEIVSKNQITASSDVYSVGIMLYEFITGALPFTGDSPLAIAWSHANDPLPRLSDEYDWIPASFDSLLALLTAKDPQRRPQNGSAALDVLTDIAGTFPEESLIRRIPVFTESATSPLAPTSIAPVIAESIDDAPVKLGLSPEESTLSETPKPTTATKKLRGKKTNPDSQKPRRWKKFLAVFAFLATIIGGTSYGVYWYFTEGPGLRVEVVNVISNEEKTAIEALTAAGFKTEVNYAYSDEVAKGLVISSNPNPGTSIHPSQLITLTVSQGVEHLEVPEVIGLTQEEASEKLTASRFKAEIKANWSETVPEGQVISQSPAAGESIPHSSTITIEVSKGREPIEVPNAVGVSEKEATDAITAKELKVNIERQYSDEVAEGVVISQSTPAGETLFRNDEVKLVISLGPELIEVPGVIGKQEGTAREILESAGFKVEVDRVLGGYFGTVRLQSPASGAKVKPGSTIKLTVV
ncbi:MAG: Stk1 family PASTA domain-containing Ser/Thr kinase [Arcanobacterium sp.]|nr:Stk1 family PASTA domain-containing Ser/Thr kinase [Arcanobacterium sp.]